jgi:hypothetical protein
MDLLVVVVRVHRFVLTAEQRLGLYCRKSIELANVADVMVESKAF